MGVALPHDAWRDDGELNDLRIEQPTLVYNAPAGGVDLSPGEGGRGVRGQRVRRRDLRIKQPPMI